MIDLEQINPLLVENTQENFRITAQKSLVRLAEKISSTSVGSSSFRSFQTDREPNLDSYTAALSAIIQSNDLDIGTDELQKWLSSSNKVVYEQKEIAEIDQHILPILAKNTALVTRSFRTTLPEPLDENTRVFQVCRLTVSTKNGRVISTGTGFFLTDTSLLTCMHVMGKQSLQDLSVQVHVPHYHGSSPKLNDVTVWSEIRFSVKKSLGSPVLLAKSSPLSDKQEKDKWTGSPTTKHLDYCVLEIDENTEQWAIGVTADKDTMPHVNANFVLSVLPNQLAELKKPATFYHADELNRKTVFVHTLSEELKIDTISGGSVQETSAVFHRIRYGDGSGIEYGDSGSPITNKEGELIALHNAFTGKHSQAIPIGPIFEDIREQNSELFNLIFA